MRKKIIILAVLILILFSIIFGYLYTGRKNAEKIVVNTNDGNVRIDNIYQKAEELLPDGDLTIKSTSDYSIDYYPKFSQFAISISNPDVETAKKQAEQDLIAVLGISEKDACKLNVDITVPYSVNPQYAGNIYGLSFCDK